VVFGVFSTNMDFYCAVKYDSGLGDLIQASHPDPQVQRFPGQTATI